MKWIAIVMVVTGCAVPTAPVRTPTAYDALAVWTGPEGKCSEQVTDVGVYEAELVEVQRVCRNDSPSLKGCYLVTAMGPMGETEPRPWVVTVPGRPQTVAHELAHWLYDCSGLGASDKNHEQELFLDTIQGML